MLEKLCPISVICLCQLCASKYNQQVLPMTRQFLLMSQLYNYINCYHNSMASEL
jgi:hypothetical protein